MENRAPRLLAIAVWLTFVTAAATAHPMGNFSVNHYAHIEPRADSVEILYVLDLAEIPTFELLQKWNLASDPAQPQFKQKANAQAREWVRNLLISANGRSVEPRIE